MLTAILGAIFVVGLVVCDSQLDLIHFSFLEQSSHTTTQVYESSTLTNITGWCHGIETNS